MREHLVFLLAAPMASFGSYAGHERRGSELAPMRSAVLGLVGAALGIDRGDVEGLANLRAYSVAVQPFQQSKPLRDYHTVQTVPTPKAKRPQTRGDALASVGRAANTIITFRDYRCDVLIGAAVWGNGRWPLSDFVNHLRQPVFPLYLGRKACPLAAPVNPVVVLEEGPREALAQIEIPEWIRSKDWAEEERNRHPAYSDPVAGLKPPQQIELVPGEPLDRRAWTFDECAVWHLGDSQTEDEEAA